MKPRDFWKIFFRITTISLLLFFFMSLLMLLYSLIISGWEFNQFLHRIILDNIRLAIIFGLILLLLVGHGLSAAFYMKMVTISVTFKDKKAFLSRLNIVLAKIGYRPEPKTESFLTYTPVHRARSLLFDLKISAQIEDKSSTIIGPNIYIKKLQKWLQQ